MSTLYYNPNSLICLAFKHLTNDPLRVSFPLMYKLYKVFHAIRCGGTEDRYKLL